MEVVKQQNKTLMDKMEMTNTTLEEAKRKACSLHVQVVGWSKKEAHKKMPRILEQRWGHQIFHLLQCGGWEKISLQLK